MNKSELQNLLDLATVVDAWGDAVKGSVSMAAVTKLQEHKIKINRDTPDQSYTALDESAYQDVKTGKSPKKSLTEQFAVVRKALQERDTNAAIITRFNGASLAPGNYLPNGYDAKKLQLMHNVAVKEKFPELASLVKASIKP